MDPAVIAERVRVANADEERAPRIEFVPDVWMVPMRTLTLPPATHTNAWIPGGARFVVFDPGTNDPDELVNVWDQHPDQVARLMEFIETCGGLEVATGEVAPMEDEAVQKLKSLGYTGDD